MLSEYSGENGAFHFFSPFILFFFMGSAGEHFNRVAIIVFAVRTVIFLSRNRNAAAEAIKNHGWLWFYIDNVVVLMVGRMTFRCFFG